MASPEEDEVEAALTEAISRYWGVFGVEMTGWRLHEALATLRRQAKVGKILDRVLIARESINAEAVERFEVHDDEAAEALLNQPTPDYPGAHDDDLWLRANAGYGIQESGQLMPKPKERRVPIKEETQAPARGRAVSTQASGQARNALQEPEATAAVLLASLLDDPARLDQHMESLAGLPCGRFAPVRDLLLDDAGGFEGVATHPAVLALREALGGQGGPGRAYSPEGWERAARSLAARFRHL